MNIQRLIKLVDDLSIPKDEREIALREIRKIEAAEGRDYYPSYNGRKGKEKT